MPVSGHEIGRQIVRALGLDGRRVVRVQIDIALDKPVTATVTEYVDTEQQCRDVVLVFENLKHVEVADADKRIKHSFPSSACFEVTVGEKTITYPAAAGASS